MTNDFWKEIDRQLAELKTAKTADQVCAILSAERNPYGPEMVVAADGFFAGGGGDSNPRDSLHEAGWTLIWSDASYYYAMRAPDGQSAVTYVEGDIYRGDRKVAA